MNKKIAYKDFTIKANVADLTKIELALMHMRATFIGVDRQKDTYFSVPKGRLKLREGSIETLITHYEREEDDGMERTTVYQYDLTPSSEQISKLHREHTVIGIIEKERRIYFVNNVKIHFDKIVEGKTFIEVEAIDSDDSMSIEQLRLQCTSIKDKLGIRDEELMRTGYLES